MLIRVRKCYSDVTFADDDSGDYEEEHGFIEEGGGEEGILMSVKDAIEELQGYDSLSACPVSLDRCSHVWASRSNHHGYNREETIHLSRVDGAELPSRHLYRMFRAAGLCK